MKKIILTITLIIFTFGIGFGQTNSEAEERERLRQQENERNFEQRNIEQRSQNLNKLMSVGSQINWDYKRPIFIKEIFEENSLPPQERAKINPLKEDYDRFSAFLSGKDTGLVKIILDPKCGSALVVDVNDARCSEVFPLKGNGAYYSFRLGSHAKSSASDIYYADGKFEVGFEKELLGILVELGDIPIESVDLKNADVKLLKDFKIFNKAELVEQQKIELKNGIQVSQKLYLDKVLVKPDTTYLIRTIAFRYEEQAVNDKRIDALLTFRVVRKTHNSVTILWKGLNRKDSQKLKAK